MVTSTSREATQPLRVLVLGGSSESSALVTALANDPGFAPILSLAGRTTMPAAAPIPVRVGGFGGVSGLVDYLRSNAIGALVDATHPFAVQISQNARLASAAAGCALFRVTRPPWRAGPRDRWVSVASVAEAAATLGRTPRRVFLTVGRLQLAAFAAAPQHFYLVRTIDPVGSDCGLPSAAFIIGRGPFTVAAEEALMRQHAIDVLVSKNSGGAMAAAKLEAACRLGLAVVLIARPAADDGLDVEAAIAALKAHARACRGV